MTKTAPPGPPPVGLNHRSSAGAQQPAQRVKRFRPLNRGTTPTVHVAAGGVVANRVATQAGGGLKLPIIGAGAQQQQSAGQQSVGDRGALAPAALSAAQLASARAAAAAAAAASRPLPLQQKIQALNEAYGGGAGSARGGGSGASGGGGCVVVKGSRKDGSQCEAELRGFALGVSACGGAFGRVAAAPVPSVFEFICCPGSGGGARQRPTLISSLSTDCASLAAM